MEYRYRPLCKPDCSSISASPVTDMGFQIPRIQTRAEAGCRQCPRSRLVISRSLLRSGGRRRGVQSHQGYPNASSACIDSLIREYSIHLLVRLIKLSDTLYTHHGCYTQLRLQGRSMYRYCSISARHEERSLTLLSVG
jgi:hypothetical protein